MDPVKGALTSYICTRYNTNMETKQAIYDSIMTRLFDSAHTFARAKAAIDAYLENEQFLKYRSEFYVSVDLGELWDAGKTQNVWFYDEHGKLIDFSVPCGKIRHDPYNVQATYETHFSTSPYVKKWITDLQSWFDGCGTVGRPHCRWHEPSDHVELWVSIKVELGGTSITNGVNSGSSVPAAPAPAVPAVPAPAALASR